MINKETLAHFENEIIEGKKLLLIIYLTQKEIKLYDHLQANNLHLEQEKIAHSFAEQEIEKCCQYLNNPK
ncbi:hypothetical protein ACE193_08790 [Bernardetia sp. OM2101]|uniref:hypothetical protein n=1 Tax=Bernardetia sp. OM2101 TaxID=3344876 RepID=UPI0035D0024E